MLKIRNEQSRPFQPQAEDAFVNRVMEYLRKNHHDTEVYLPESKNIKVADLSDALLREMVSGGVNRARVYEINWASNLISFVVLMFIAAPNFDEAEKVKEVLLDEKIEVEKRIDKLLARLTDHDWEKIAKTYSAKAWQLPMREAEIMEEVYERTV